MQVLFVSSYLATSPAVMTPAGEGEVGAAHLAHRHSVVRHPHGGRGTQRRRQDRNVGGTRREGRRPGPEVLDGGADGFNPVDAFTNIPAITACNFRIQFKHFYPF